MPVYRLGDDQPQLPEPGAAWIAPNAVVIGKVEVGPDASIWWNAVVRGDNDRIVIGPRSNVQDGAVLHVDAGAPLEIGEGVTVGHMAMLHGCTVEDNVLIGMGAVVLNRAVIGRNCLIGAGALIPEGKVIAPGSLVIGRPGTAVRELTEDEVERQVRSAQGYVERWRRYARDLAEVG